MTLTRSVGTSYLARARNALGQFQKRSEGLAELAVIAGAEAGAEELRRGLLAATTKTGRKRARTQGGEPGRYESGTMVEAIKTDAETPFYDGERIFVSFGWFPDDFQDYFAQQENGDPGANIPAAMAMPNALLVGAAVARAAFLSEGARL